MIINDRKIPAWTLPEVLFVAVIISGLIAMSLPKILPLFSKTQSIEAQGQLKLLYEMQDDYYNTHFKYATTLEELGFEQDALITTDGGNAKYQIELTNVTATSFIVKATAVVDFDRDGVYNVWEVDNNKKIVERIKD